jgi:type III pantothenate kinase
MNLIIDIGNTLTKLFVFEQNKIVYSNKIETGNQIDTEDLFVKNNINNAIISSVAGIQEGLVHKIKKQTQNLIILDFLTQLPIKNLYKTPETLGKDRLAAIVGAHNIFPGHNVLAIDAGTAITFDFINKNAEYLGGNISPGLAMRYQALNYFTNKLPLLEKSDQFPFIGQNTDEAIIAGVQNGIIFEINAYIDKFAEEYDDLKVILTGGDTFFFAHKLKCPIFAEPFLVAIGLNRILQNNVEKI